MIKMIRERLVDDSNEKEFRFYLVCEVCKKAWEFRPIRFSKADIEPPTESKRIVFEKLYQKEKEWALSRVAEEAVHYFNLCPVCGRLVCNDCFMICEDLDMCQECAESLQEEGESVTQMQMMEQLVFQPKNMVEIKSY